MIKFILPLLLFAFSASAQDTTKYMPMSAKGYKFNGATFKNIWIGQDTTNYKTGIARIDTTLYAGNGTKWTAVGSGSFTGVDSLVITTTGCVKSFSTWKQGTQTVVGTVTQSNGVSPGTGIVTKTTGTTFTVSAATYTINCVTYQSRDTTITLTTAGDTGRIDVIKVNTSGVTTFGTGIEGEALALPSLTADELALSYILVTDTGVVSAPPAETPTWDYVATNLTTHNPLSNVGIGGAPAGFKLQIFGTSALGVGNVNHFTRFGPGLQIDYDGVGPRLFSTQRIGINGQSGLNIVGLGSSVSDTGTYKLMSIDNSGNVKRFSYWPGGGSGGSVGTLQQVLTAGSTLTTDNTIDVDGNQLNIDDVVKFNVKSRLAGSTYSEMQVAQGEFFAKSENATVATILNLRAGIGYLASSFADTLKFQFKKLPISNDVDYALGVQNDTVKRFTPFTVAQLTDSLNIIRDSLNILRDSLAAYRAEDTVYTASGIETVYSGDSTTIRLPYKSYVAIIDIDGAGTDPTVIVLQNDLGGTVVWTRAAVGMYAATLTSAFTDNKTVMPNMSLAKAIDNTSSGFHILSDDGSFIRGIGKFTTPNINEIKLYTLDTTSGVPDDMPLRKFAVEIRVFY